MLHAQNHCADWIPAPAASLTSGPGCPWLAVATCPSMSSPFPAASLYQWRCVSPREVIFIYKHIQNLSKEKNNCLKIGNLPLFVFFPSSSFHRKRTPARVAPKQRRTSLGFVITNQSEPPTRKYRAFNHPSGSQGSHTHTHSRTTHTTTNEPNARTLSLIRAES